MKGNFENQNKIQHKLKEQVTKNYLLKEYKNS